MQDEKQTKWKKILNVYEIKSIKNKHIAARNFAIFMYVCVLCLMLESLTLLNTALAKLVKKINLMNRIWILISVPIL